MLKESDIYKIKQKSAWDENRKEWTVPAFILTDKKQDVSFPTINGKQRVEQVRDERSIQFDGQFSDSKSQGRQLGNFQNSTATNSIYGPKHNSSLIEDENFKTKSDFGGDRHGNGTQVAPLGGNSVDMVSDRRNNYRQMQQISRKEDENDNILKVNKRANG